MKIPTEDFNFVTLASEENDDHDDNDYHDDHDDDHDHDKDSQISDKE